MARKKPKSKKSSSKKSPARKSKRSATSKSLKHKSRKPKRRPPSNSGRPSDAALVAYEPRGLGPRSAGQSGDTQGLSGSPGVDSESVEELMEEGQSFEAEVLDGVENVPDPDEGEVRTHEVPEDDVPDEYKGQDERDVG